MIGKQMRNRQNKTYLFVVFFFFIWQSIGFGFPGKIFIESASDSFALQKVLKSVNDGDSIIVSGGRFSGPLKINKTITLIGKNKPIIDGHLKNTVLKITAPNVTIDGFVIQNSGRNLSREDAGITVEAPAAIIRNNIIKNVLFGVYLKQSHKTVVKNNIVSGIKDIPVPRRGDLVRIWYSREVIIDNNILRDGRDVIIWFSDKSIISNNQVSGARYGLHFMYSDNCVITQNLLINNSVGCFLMYSRRLKLIKNTIAYNRGPSGFGIGVKDFDDGVFDENIIFDNRVGIFIDNSPREMETTMHYEKNVFAYNDIGINIFPYIKRSFFIENSFIENYQQVNVEEGSPLTGNEWRNNYWSDYAGYDFDGDGIGDLPYKSEKLYENLMGKNPELRLFIYSPAIQAIDFAARAFPLIKPIPAFADEQPKINPYIPEGLPSISLPPRMPLLIANLTLAFFGLFIMWFFSRKKTAIQLSLEKPDHDPQKDYGNVSKKFVPTDGEKFMLSVKHLYKSFGKNVVLKDISFDVREGESIALFGENGAGKTTIIRCLLGLLPFSGKIQVDGFDVEKDLKSVRHLIGFVPQEINLYNDMSVQDTIEFFSRLKKSTHNSIEDWLQKLGLDTLREKKVAELSGGMKQRLALILALISDPPILLLDEPTANLDVQSRKDFLDLIKGLRNENKTILFASHRLDEISTLASRVLILKEGKLISDCSPGEIYDKLGKQFMLKVHIPSRYINSALEALQKEGFQASRNENGIRISVEASQKGKPLTYLIKNDIPVNDFDYEILNGSEPYE